MSVSALRGRRPSGLRAPLPAVLALGVLAFAVLAGCHRHASPIAQAFAVPLTRGDTCAVDGMILMEHPGPKGQVLLPDGTRRYYCDLKELFGDWFDRERTPAGSVAFVQAMDGRAWAAHADGWVRADQARYVLGSSLAGAMGPTLVPFRQQAAAEAFIASHGGRLVAYQALDAEALARYAREVREMMRDNRVVYADGGTGPHPMQGMPMAGRAPAKAMSGMPASHGRAAAPDKGKR